MAYFSHDEGARNDPKLVKVLMRLGQAGKGVYWDLVEMLYEQGGYLPLAEVESYAFALRTEPELVAKLINDFGLFKQDAERFWSESVLDRMHLRNTSQQRRAAAGSKGGKARAEREAIAKAALEQPLSNAQAMLENPEALLNDSQAIKGKEIKGKESKVNPLLSVEDAASAAAPAPVEKVIVEPLPESPTIAPHTEGGAADVGTQVAAPMKASRGGKKLKAEPGSTNPADYQLPEWAGQEFKDQAAEWLARRQTRTDVKPLQPAAIQEYFNEMAGYTPDFCDGLFSESRKHPNWQGLTFKSTKLDFAQHIQKLQQLQVHASRLNQPERGAKPTESAAFGARALSAQLRAIREERSAQNGSYVHLGTAAGANVGGGAPVPPGVGTPQG